MKRQENYLKKLFALKFGLFKCVIKNQNKLFMHGTARN